MMTYDIEFRVKSLMEAQRYIQSADLSVDAEFKTIIRLAQELLEITDRQMADFLSVSRPTINRWTNGRNLPYLALRKPVRSWILDQLGSKIKTVEGLRRTSSYASA